MSFFFRYLALVILCLPLAPAFAEPCLDQAIPLFNVGVTAYPDCTEADVVYFVPQNLKIAENILSGEKAFSWKLDPSGNSAKVLIKSRLFVDQGRVLQALLDLKKIKPLRYRIRPFGIADVKFDGFDEEGIISQKMLATGAFSDSYFSILLTLDKQGIALWKEAAEFETWTLSPATITYALQGKNGGVSEQRVQTHQLEIASLPACIILGSGCPVTENEARIIPQAKSYGRLQFHLQYVSCPDFRTQNLQEPPRAAFDDSSMTADEQWIAWHAAVDAFHEEHDRLKTECAPVLERLDGEEWFRAFKSAQKISCSNLYLWTFDRIISGQQDRSEIWRKAVRDAYDLLLKSCNVVEGYNCNELNAGQVCHGKLRSPTLVCFEPGFMKQKVSLTQGQCQFMIMTQNAVGSWIQSGFSKTTVEEAKLAETCISTSKTLPNESSYRAIVDCR